MYTFLSATAGSLGQDVTWVAYVMLVLTIHMTHMEYPK
jgi:hypothetical protein